MNNADNEYFRLAQFVLDKGKRKTNRTGIDTIGTFGAQARFDLSEGFPLLTTKKVFFKGIAHELLWFLSGSTNIKYLVDNGVHIWDDNAFDNFWKKAKNDELYSTQWLSVNKNDPAQKQRFINRIKEDKEFADKWGDLGEGTYGGMWRNFPYYTEGGEYEDRQGFGVDTGYVDQIQNVLNKLKSNPDDRRLIISAWHPYWVDHCALPPCHCLFQFHTEELTLEERHQEYLKNITRYFGPYSDDPYESTRFDSHEEMDSYGVPERRLNLQLYQRSCDLFLGVPFNIASYALLLSMVAQVSNMVPGEFIHTYGDLHIYVNHLDQINEQMKREPRDLPTLKLNTQVQNLFDFKYEDFKVENYNPHSAIKAEMAV